MLLNSPMYILKIMLHFTKECFEIKNITQPRLQRNVLMNFTQLPIKQTPVIFQTGTLK